MCLCAYIKTIHTIKLYYIKYFKYTVYNNSCYMKFHVHTVHAVYYICVWDRFIMSPSNIRIRFFFLFVKQIKSNKSYCRNSLAKIRSIEQFASQSYAEVKIQMVLGNMRIYFPICCISPVVSTDLCLKCAFFLT